ncbi:chemotaxis-specific protein-glutamate methyltransferase CheB [Glaciecola sp. XM2]|jgi:two-component system chemotaxis response regulator CheB|uniref:chemotaxis-specific protein-glutamate methyltransferase CheB n=1 Tax=Glaciecola sp. XM2 TaxID=1914931 RepID=UPI001BDF1419|nr:chemotaxis-specific protein-glutamate methyltransferase CheB [Glaciecola sp. XM2]MBT1450116.1 chemotaxis-specific protein-glutamate methyltransferase CheB [Glaciecola sp. XM2]
MPAKAPIKVMVVDDSSLMRSHICSALVENGMVTDTAANGQECLNKLNTFVPDVITLDINMPVMDGLACLKRIMQNRPTPVVMVSSLTQKNAEETLQALEMGAVDYVGKPHGPVSLTLNRSKYMLVSKVLNASKIKVKAKSTGRVVEQKTVARPLNMGSLGGGGRKFDLVIMGVSTGGPSSLNEILPKLPANYPYPVVIAQHMPSRFTQVFAARLDKMCEISVSELTSPTALQPGHVYIAQGDANVEVFARGSQLWARPNDESTEHIWRPSITKLVESALLVVSHKKLCCVQLTGMGNDGAQAMAKAHSLGATTFAESEKTATVYGMPKELVKLGGASKVLPNYDIAQALLSLN